MGAIGADEEYSECEKLLGTIIEEIDAKAEHDREEKNVRQAR